ncbi:MAG TPA: acetyl-CoA carboxylase biotin carboxyl carrier protein [Candidatus Copromonas avistercoris]|nr:acetyl-CoA carboxylase biotin carboxyl carrier protein [Candidatus Copromonas avistercoris]
MEIKDIIQLMEAAAKNGLTSFELEEGDWKLSMKREKKLVSAAVPAAEAGAQSAAASGILSAASSGMSAVYGQNAGNLAANPASIEASGVSSDQVVTCPLVGTFYSAPSPDAEDFVKVGDTVKKGQVLGIVEAMKLMNEIESDYDGVVEAILVKDGETVEYGQPLFRIH